MANVPLASGECCLPNADGVTYLRLGSRERIVGMIGLDRVFEQLYLMGRRPEETTDAELVGMARRFSYIPARSTIEAEYAQALRRAYALFHAQRER